VLKIARKRPADVTFIELDAMVIDELSAVHPFASNGVLAVPHGRVMGGVSRCTAARETLAGRTTEGAFSKARPR
jgi:hypothetical protein